MVKEPSAINSPEVIPSFGGKKIEKNGPENTGPFVIRGMAIVGAQQAAPLP